MKINEVLSEAPFNTNRFVQGANKLGNTVAKWLGSPTAGNELIKDKITNRTRQLANAVSDDFVEYISINFPNADPNSVQTDHLIRFLQDQYKMKNFLKVPGMAPVAQLLKGGTKKKLSKEETQAVFYAIANTLGNRGYKLPQNNNPQDPQDQQNQQALPPPGGGNYSQEVVSSVDNLKPELQQQVYAYLKAKADAGKLA